MDKEEIYVNLRVIQGLDKNQKLISRGAYLNVEPMSIIPEFIRRWHRQDNRNECLKKIDLVVNSAINYINTINDNIEQQSNINTRITLIEINKDEQINPIVKDIQTMKSYLKDGLKGIQNLKETYATDTQTCARLDVIINKILNILDNE